MITQLICHFELDTAKVAKQYEIDFASYFAVEIEELQKMQSDGLVSVTPERIEVQPAGKLLIRNICMVFDRYLREKAGQRFSKVI